MLLNINWYLYVKFLLYGFIWWLLNLNCVFFIKIEINLEVYIIKIIFLVMGSEFLWKIYSSFM